MSADRERVATESSSLDELGFQDLLADSTNDRIELLDMTDLQDAVFGLGTGDQFTSLFGVGRQRFFDQRMNSAA